MRSQLCRGGAVTVLPAGAGDEHGPLLLPGSEHADHPSSGAGGGGLEQKLLCSGCPGCPELARTIPAAPGEGSAALGLVPAHSWLPHCGALREELLQWITLNKGKSWNPGFFLSGSTSSPLFLPFLVFLSAIPACSRAEQRGWLSIFLWVEEGVMKCRHPPPCRN